VIYKSTFDFVIRKKFPPKNLYWKGLSHLCQGRMFIQ